MHNIVYHELKEHAPFTFLGALSGIVLFVLLRNIPYETSHQLFYIFHPIHVLFSSFVTVSLYILHTKEKKSFLKIFLIGYFGSIGIATISDSIIPFLGEALLNFPERHVHLGFIEKWYIVNPLAFLGIILATFKPFTKFPHFGHVLLSTWASLFHVLMSISGALNLYTYTAILFLLFFAVWLPCCVSDIVFPLLFIKEKD